MMASRMLQNVKIKRGQWWLHQKAGYVMEIIQKRNGSMWTAVNVSRKHGLGRAHKIKEHDLYKQFKLIR